MTNVNELKEALKETLEEKGILNNIRASLRATIFEVIETDDKPKPKLSDENLIINELIREYLKYNNYMHSSSVFIAESGQPIEPPFDRNFISKELNIVEDQSSKKVPLLYSILFGLKKEIYDGRIQENIKNNAINSFNQHNNRLKEQSINLSSKDNKNINYDISKQNQPQPWNIEN